MKQHIDKSKRNHPLISCKSPMKISYGKTICRLSSLPFHTNSLCRCPKPHINPMDMHVAHRETTDDWLFNADYYGDRKAPWKELNKRGLK